MFNFSFPELALVGAIALIVLGPERLPHAARTAGLWVGKLKRLMAQVQQELTSQLNADEFKAHVDEQRQALNRSMQKTRHEVHELQRQITPSSSSTPTADPETDTTTETSPHTVATQRDRSHPRPLIATQALKPSSSTERQE